MKLNFAAFALVLALIGNAAAYPDKPVRIVVPFPPGGGTDVIARTILTPMSELLGGAMFIDNRTGANGGVGADFVAKAKPDGYTLMLGGTGAVTTNPYIQDVTYDADKDFAPVTLLVKSDILLLVNPKLPVRTVQEFIKYAKERPGQVRFASPGIGSPNHLMGELFSSLADVKLVHVPYRGEGPAFTDLVGGHVDAIFGSVAGGSQFVTSGALIAIAICGIKRSSEFPNVPTIDESGVPGYDATSWQGIFAPAGTPPEIITKIQQAVVTVYKDQKIRDAIAAQGNTPVGNTPEEFEAFVRNERVKWGKVITAAGLAKSPK